MILSTGELRHLVHILLDDFGYGIVILVHCFAALEVDILILGSHFQPGLLGTLRTITELLDVFGLNQGLHIVVGNFLDLLYFM